ncbi:MAG: hypothetical protein LQ338_007880, partial [Usnochroma carphineum]
MDPPPTKYRASCDGCYLAKVKCGKDPPVCPRCKNLGLECRYSPSQRVGKSRGQKIQALPASKASEWPSNNDNSTTVSSQLGTLLPTTKGVHHLHQDLGVRSNLQPNSYSPHPSESETAFSADSPGGSTSMLQDLDDINFLTPWRDYLPNLDKEQSVFKFKSSNDFGAFPDAANIVPSPISTPASQLFKDQEFIQMTAFPITSGCNCVSSLAQALQAMQNQSTHPLNTPPALETILGDGKDVVARGEALLHCTCSDDSTAIMLFTSLVAKHLSFYGPATYILDSPQRHHNDMIPSTSSSAATSLVSTSSSSPSAGGGGSSRVTIGTYILDAEGEERLRIKIMVMELQKLGALLG